MSVDVQAISQTNVEAAGGCMALLNLLEFKVAESVKGTTNSQSPSKIVVSNIPLRVSQAPDFIHIENNDGCESDDTVSFIKRRDIPKV